MNYNKYKLSEKFNQKKNEYEKIIEQNTKEYFALNKKLNDLISGKEISDTNKEYEILNLKTRLLTLEVDINSNKRAIEELYIREMDSNLNKSRLNKEIDSTEFADQKRRLNSMKILKNLILLRIIPSPSIKRKRTSPLKKKILLHSISTKQFTRTFLRLDSASLITSSSLESPRLG